MLQESSEVGWRQSTPESADSEQESRFQNGKIQNTILQDGFLRMENSWKCLEVKWNQFREITGQKASKDQDQSRSSFPGPFESR